MLSCMSISFHVKYRYSSQILMKFICPDRFSNNTQKSNFTKIRVQWELSSSMQTDMTKLIVAYRNFTDAPKNLQYSFIIHLVLCLTTGPKPLSTRALHIVRSRASAFKRKYPLFSLKSSCIFIRLLPRLSVTSISLLYLSLNNPL
jgi:hypothetical protein